MRDEISAYRWTCDDCGKILIAFDYRYPEGWEEVDDNPRGECQERCDDCVKNMPRSSTG